MPNRLIQKRRLAVCARGLCLLFPALLMAQPDSLKWGEVPAADLKMTAFPDDSNAAALILGDMGTVSFTIQGEMIFQRHRRIKILSSGGYQWGNVDIPYYAEKRMQQVDQIRGQTLRLAAEGSVRRDSLDQKSIFDEDVDGEYRRIRFSLPALEPGVVVEYSYRMVSKNFAFLHGWEFQTSEPTRYSEFRADIPQHLEYVMVRDRIAKFDVEEATLGVWQALQQESKRRRTIFLGSPFSTVHRWGKRSVPALRPEPFMTTPDDFCARIRFQLSKIKWLGRSDFEYLNSWEKLAGELMKEKRFGQQLSRHNVLRRQAEELTAGLAAPEEKMRAIYDYVRATMAWNGKRGIYPDEDLDKAFKARRGDGPGIALMLTAMLRFAGLEAHPVLISTRDNGKSVKHYSILTQFNHVLTYVKLGERDCLLDATDPLRPDDLLPVAALNEAAWLVDPKNPRWVDVPKSGSFSSQTMVLANLAENGTITAHLMTRADGYNGLFERDSLRHKKDEEYIRERWLDELPDAKVDSFKIVDRDSTHKPLMVDAFFSTANHAQAAGDKIYFYPILFGRRAENPFKRAERIFPIDFAYPRTSTYTLNLVLPEGCVVEELPRNIAIGLPNGDGHFKRLIEVEGNNFQIMSQLVIRKTCFAAAEYETLREFYDRMVAAQAEQVVLKRIAAVAATKK